MIDDFISLQVVVVSDAEEDRELFRQALSTAPVPIELRAVESAAAGNGSLESDVLYIDDRLAPADLRRILTAARAAGKAPFTVVLTAGETGSLPSGADALARKPVRREDFDRFIERSLRLRLPSGVLVVDHSPTVRGIVRKLIAATRFPLDVSEAADSSAAMKLVDESTVDLVFLDCNVPDCSGLETLRGLRRENRSVDVVMMTSRTEPTLADHARELGADFLRKPFYAGDMENVFCRFYGLLALNPERA